MQNIKKKIDKYFDDMAGLLRINLERFTDLSKTVAASNQAKDFHLQTLEAELAALRQEKASLKETAAASTFGPSLIRGDDSKTRFYTGFPTYAVFSAFAEYIRVKAAALHVWRGP